MTNNVGLTSAEAKKLAGLIPANCFVIGAEVDPQDQLDHIRKMAGEAELILAIIPICATMPPNAARGADDRRLVSGSALAWLVKQAAPVLAPQSRLNGVSGLEHADDDDIAIVLNWLASSPSVVGQVVALDGLPAEQGPESA